MDTDETQVRRRAERRKLRAEIDMFADRRAWALRSGFTGAQVDAVVDAIDETYVKHGALGFECCEGCEFDRLIGKQLTRKNDEYRKLERFAGHMRNELEANKDKGHWARYGDSELIEELDKHVAKLKAAILAGDKGAMREHAADVANCAFFVSDKTGALHEPPAFSNNIYASEY